MKRIMKGLVSPQYLQEENIYVTIIEVKTPVHYVVKQSPSINTTSMYASKFLELEESMQKYYGSLEQSFFQLPVKDTILIVEHEQKYYRAKVCSILNLPRSYLIKVYLLDYGKECSVPKSSLFEMHPDFMTVPFQAVDFKLPGLEPMSLVMNPYDLTLDYGTSPNWDASVYEFIGNIRKALHSAFIKVEGAQKNCIFGTLHVTLCDGEEICINDDLVLKKFASKNPECWNNITKLNEILSKENLQSHSNISLWGSNCPESSKSLCIINKPIPAFELNSPKSSVVSAIDTESLENGPKNSSEKLREILRIKKAQEQSKTLFSEEKKEWPCQSNVENKDLMNEIRKCGDEVVADFEAVLDEAEEITKKHSSERNKSKPVQDFEKFSEESVLKTTNQDKCDQIISVSPNASTLREFREKVARKRAAHKQQALSQTLNDNSLTISTASSEFVQTEKSVCQLTSSLTLQDASGSKISPPVKFDSEQSVKFPASPLTHEEISKKAGPVKVKEFYEKQRKARAIFLAQKKSKQDQNDANSQLSMISIPPKPSETGSPLVAAETNILPKSCGATNPAVEKSCDENYHANELNLADESSESNQKSMESKVLQPKEIPKSKVEPGKISAFYAKNRKARALYLAQAKSKQENEGSQSERASIACRPSEIESKPVAASAEAKCLDKSQGNKLDDSILELANDSSSSTR